jgi:hypothetical protein
MRFRLVIRFIRSSIVVTTFTFYTVAGLHNLQSLHINLLSLSAFCKLSTGVSNHIYYIPIYFLVGSAFSVAYICITKAHIILLLNVLEIRRRHILIEFMGYKPHGCDSNPTGARFYSTCTGAYPA